MRVVIGVRDLDESDARFEQATAEEAMPAEVVIAVPIAQRRRLAADVEQALPSHDLLRLRERVRVGFGIGGAPALGEAVVDAAEKGSALRVGGLGQRRRSA